LLAQKSVLSQKPDIIVSTPARILAHLRQKNVSLKDSLEMLVLDEADCFNSFGFEDDLKNILEHFLPSTYQVKLFT
jgi:ATP-dependent RNA helicase DDX56/DBP9